MPPQLVSVVRVMGAAPSAVFRKVVLPSALPFILTALRLTIPAALIGAVIGEFSVHRDMSRAGRAGMAAWIGFAVGAAVKIALAFAMIAVFVVAFFLF